MEFAKNDPDEMLRAMGNHDSACTDFELNPLTRAGMETK